MAASASDALQSLRDLPGVVGSFVCAADGALLCRDLPAYFDDAALAEVGPRASRILETWSASPQDAECVVRFEEHRLYLRGTGDNLLCVIVGAEVQVPEMRTAAGMVARRLRGQLAAQAAAPEPSKAQAERSEQPAQGAPAEPAPVPASEPAAPARPPRSVPGSSPRKRARVYRGQRFE